MFLCAFAPLYLSSYKFLIYIRQKVNNMAELGKIEKPDNKHYSGKKKLYCVRNMYLVEDAPEEYKSLFNKYWDEVAQQIEKIEVAGKIKTVF